METKICSKCKEEKFINDFGKNKRKSDGLEPRCRECVNTASRERYAKDPQKKIAQTRKYHLEHPEWSKQQLRKHHEANAAIRYERQKLRLQDPEKRAKARESSRRSEARRRAIKRAGVADFISVQQVTSLIKDFNNQCYICLAEFNDIIELQLDHFMPIAKGGQHTLENIKPACADCNRRKNAIWPITDEILIRIKTATLEQRAMCSDSQEVTPGCL